MTNYSKLLKIIEQYYPKNISYEDPMYKLTSQYLNLFSKKKEYMNNKLLKYRFNKPLINLFKGYEVINRTDFESSNCYEYRILLHKNQKILDDDIELMNHLNGKRVDLFIFISILEKYYYYFTNETLYDFNIKKWSFKNVKLPNRILPLVSEFNNFMSHKGYEKLDDTMVRRIVDEIETEHIEKGKVNIFNCLFTDLISLN
ncbi:MAG: hypothetical protein H0Z33_15100 [Bacillaceae bacterium]|nr:hypothetical protein [Bacillaceae bacterium]